MATEEYERLLTDERRLHEISDKQLEEMGLTAQEVNYLKSFRANLSGQSTEPRMFASLGASTSEKTTDPTKPFKRMDAGEWIEMVDEASYNLLPPEMPSIGTVDPRLPAGKGIRRTYGGPTLTHLGKS